MQKKSLKFGGFWFVPKEPKGLTPQARLVLGMFCTYANGENEAWPGQELIAEEIGCGVRSVRRYIDELIAFGLIERTTRGLGQTNLYVLLTGQIGLSRPDIAVPSGPDTGVPSYIGVKEELDKKSIAPAEPSQPAKRTKLDPNEPQTLEQFVASCETNTRRSIQIIGMWAETVNPGHTTRGEWSVFLKRCLRAADNLSPFTDEKLQNGFDRLEEAIKAGWLTTYSLDTLFKFTTNTYATTATK